MALLVFLRGMNVGGHRRLRPSELARTLERFGVVSIGAAGTFVVRRPGRRARFMAELRRRLPDDAIVATCDSLDLERLETDSPLADARSGADLVPFVSVLSKPSRRHVLLPTVIPRDGQWFVRIVGRRQRLVYGVYRRHMKTIGHLGRIDDLFAAPATTRSWSTMLTVLRAVDPRPLN
jgi:uncharacterized protein (DUF1697 family)